jgi:deoxyhypusine synthase
MEVHTNDENIKRLKKMKKSKRRMYAPPEYSNFKKLYIGSGLTKKEKKVKKKILSREVKSVNLEKTRSVADLVAAFGNTSVQARNIGLCAKVYENTLRDPDRPTIFLGLAGPLIAGGLRKTIRDMIEFGIVDVVVSTGAILYQDIYQARGYKHYIGSPDVDDGALHDLLINRIYDTYVDDEKFADTDEWVSRFADGLKPRTYSTREFLYLLSEKLNDKNSILVTARKHGVPVFCPAINDSSIGIGLTEHYRRRALKHENRVVIDAIRDNYELTQIVVKSKKTAAVYVAGGVPKNFINDSVVMGYIFGRNMGGHTYAFQVTTDVPHWGGLSGSTLDEAKSWGKISKKATKAMAFVEPTVSLPLIVGYVLQRGYWKGRKRLQFKWASDVLEKIEQR